MNLVTDYLENSFEIKGGVLNTLVIEDKAYFTKFLQSFMGVVHREHQEFELIDDFKKLDLARSTEVIFDLFSLDANNARVLKKLYEELEADLNSVDMYTKKLAMENTLINTLDDLIYRSRFSLHIGEIDYQTLFKALAVAVDYDQESLLERLTEYMEVTSEMLGKDLFVITNLDSFLNDEDLHRLRTFLCYNQIKVLALQNSLTREVNSCENLRIVDKDLCEI